MTPARVLILLLCFGSCAPAQTVAQPAQNGPQPGQNVAQAVPRPAEPAVLDQLAQSLADAQRWDAVVRLLQPVQPRSAALDLDYGIALAHLNQPSQAESVLLAGRRLAPADPRFPVELAGIAFQQKRYPLAARLLGQALRFEPNDDYANNFLATVYFLQGNLEAALKYWNRLGKPQVAAVREDPVPRLSPALLDHAFAFSPAAVLTRPQLETSRARLDGLGVFSHFHFELIPQPDGRYNLVFRNQERNGFGGGKLQALILSLRGLPFLQVNPAYANLHGQAINFSSMYRWDPQKRRIFAQVSGPLFQAASFRWDVFTDLRNENWALRNSFMGIAPVLAGFNLRSEVANLQLDAYPNGRLAWSAAAAVSHRNFRSVFPGAVLTPQMLASGYQLSQQAALTATLLSLPGHRFTLTAGAASRAARLWSPTPQSFQQLTGSIGWHWQPRPFGHDYETRQDLRAGRTFGQPPFDQLFILGLERDNDLPMRAHIGTRDGIKGSAPLGRNYLLQNWEMDKNLYSNGLVELQLGPFLDVGRITDPGTQLGSHKSLWDTGAQAKVRVLGVGLVFSYGKDLRSGNNAFYVSLLP